MSPQPSDAELHKLKDLERELMSAGLSRSGAHCQIAEKVRVDRVTVYRWLTPGNEASTP